MFCLTLQPPPQIYLKQALTQVLSHALTHSMSWPSYDLKSIDCVIGAEASESWQLNWGRLEPQCQMQVYPLVHHPPQVNLYPKCTRITEPGTSAFHPSNPSPLDTMLGSHPTSWAVWGKPEPLSDGFPQNQWLTHRPFCLSFLLTYLSSLYHVFKKIMLRRAQ